MRLGLALALSMMLCCQQRLVAQEMDVFKKHLAELVSEKYHGRGYAQYGALKAAYYLEEAYAASGLEVTSQDFRVDINTFPSHASMSVDGKALVAGDDFSMREFSPGAHGRHKLLFIDTQNYDSLKVREWIQQPENEGAFGVIDFYYPRTQGNDALFREKGAWQQSLLSGMIYTFKDPMKYYKAYGDVVEKKPIVWATESSVTPSSRQIEIDVDNVFLDQCPARNVMARLKGNGKSDSTIVFVAHYDHLGVFGQDLYFPGANDNASGTAMLLMLADYYSHQPQLDYDLVFLSVSGEEANLRGSTYFAEHPLVDLDKIRYLINLDMIGDDCPDLYCEVGEEGERGFMLFEALNKKLGGFKSLARSPLASNSDHWPFAQKGVPCIFLMNENGSAYPYYHTYHDTLETMSMASVKPVFELVKAFLAAY